MGGGSILARDCTLKRDEMVEEEHVAEKNKKKKKKKKKTKKKGKVQEIVPQRRVPQRVVEEEDGEHRLSIDFTRCNCAATRRLST